MLANSQVSANVLVGALVVLAASCGVAYGVVEHGAVGRVRRLRRESARESEDAAVAAYRQLTIIRAGLVEGPCFLGCLTYMLTHSRVALGAVVLGVLFLLSRTPSADGLCEFMDRMREV